MTKKKRVKVAKKSLKRNLAKSEIKKKGAYRESWEFLKECRNYIWFVIGLFFLVSIIVYFGVQSSEINNILVEYLKKIAAQFEGRGILETILLIFKNNVFASFIGVISGVFFGVFPVLYIIVNGYALGFVAQKSVDIAGISILWKLFPHGIFELPAVFISFALGIKLGTFVFAVHPWQILKEYFFKSMRVFFYIVIPLLIIAAIIEGILIGLMG